MTPLAEFVAARTDGNYELITAEGAYKGPAHGILGKFLGTSWNTSEVDDEWYKAKLSSQSSKPRPRLTNSNYSAVLKHG